MTEQCVVKHRVADRTNIKWHERPLSRTLRVQLGGDQLLSRSRLAIDQRGDTGARYGGNQSPERAHRMRLADEHDRVTYGLAHHGLRGSAILRSESVTADASASLRIT